MEKPLSFDVVFPITPCNKIKQNGIGRADMIE